VKKNRTIIGKIIDLVRLLGKLNLPFRGHREDESSLNKGVFKEFLAHVAKSDSIIHNNLSSSAGNVNYRFFSYT
jgi:hypothetical protein